MDPDVQFVIAVSGAKAEKTGAAMNEYNDACALAAWSAAAFTVSRAASVEAPMTVETLKGLFSEIELYNPNVPNLAEVVRQVRNENKEASIQDIRTTIINAIRSTESHFKTSIPAVMGPLVREYI